MRRIIEGIICALILLASTTLPRLQAQRTNDVARLVVGVSGGFIGRAGLWRTTQPMITRGTAIDTFKLDRGIRSNINLTGHVAYFPNPRFGINGELAYLGLGTVDNCFRPVDINDQVNRLACTALAGQKRAASAIALMGGGIWRPIPAGDVQPYVKGQLGVALTPRSTSSMTAVFGEDDAFALPIYRDEHTKEISPAAALGVGFATAPRNGYQFSVEFRATAVRLSTVDGPAPLGSQDPKIGSKWAVMPTITLGFDIVLERRRGRRY